MPKHRASAAATATDSWCVCSCMPGTSCPASTGAGELPPLGSGLRVHARLGGAGQARSAGQDSRQQLLPRRVMQAPWPRELTRRLCRVSKQAPSLASSLHPPLPPPPLALRSCDVESPGAYYAITATMGGLLLLMLGAYFVLAHLVRRELSALPFNKFRLANLALRLQVRPCPALPRPALPAFLPALLPARLPAPLPPCPALPACAGKAPPRALHAQSSWHQSRLRAAGTGLAFLFTMALSAACAAARSSGTGCCCSLCRRRHRPRASLPPSLWCA